jgi:hypothetical protein
MAKFKVTVPIDASSIETIEKGQQVKVVAVDAKGARQVQTAKIDGKKAAATFSFDQAPENLRVFVGPGDAADDEVDKLQNAATATVSARAFSKAEITLDPIIIRPPQWEWWLRWCRTFTVHGRIVCPDGSPVPGAQVCAYDVDWFLWWRSTQLVSCTQTNANGEFTMRFRWCCGWWPWWWWRLREWTLDTDLLERLVKVLPAELKVHPIPLPDPAPDLRFIEPLLGRPTFSNVAPVNLSDVKFAAATTLQPAMPAARETNFGSENFDFARLETTRESLAQRLPRIPELEPLRLWPWWPWAPWYDCAPDLIFRATQDCVERGTVIVNESIFSTRWNVPTSLDVTLVANRSACCVPPVRPGEDCLVLDQVCSTLTEHIGGNIGAPATPAGFADPGVNDRPFGGVISVYGTNETLTNAEYYAVERAPNGTSAWAEVPLGQLAGIGRTYLDLSAFPFTWHDESFSPANLDGHNVYESRHHYEVTHPGPAWGSASGRIWVGFSSEQVLSWVTSTPTVADGVYKLRVQGYNMVAGHLVPVAIPSCGGRDPSGNPPSEVVVAVDNRLDPDPLHATYPPHPCGAGTVHGCVTEPDTDFLSITIVPAGGGAGTLVEACNAYSLHNNDTVEIRFYAYDPNAHLHSYSLTAYYGENDFFPIVPPHTAVGDGSEGVIPAAAPSGVAVPSSYVPVASAQWEGGVMKVTVHGSDFPRTCCYLLDLRAYKRTIVSCGYDHQHYNVSQRSFMVTKV